ncbi:mersacidin/lichenicidin family type 2 lantibiotic [Kibdelosporangium lantanae]|uniref:Mersacidin/lichenicidin family type 2 lantibiotic n=1 Tax=Kibdelosporangium lantanae TaxID=1497396 RepID=A0ABW3M9S1_9PSEU
MTNDVVRAWKDPEYRAGLAAAPEHPAGDVDLRRIDFSDFDAVGAAAGTGFFCTFTLTPNVAWCVISLSVC